MLLVVGEVGAAFQALLAAALDAARGLPLCFLLGIPRAGGNDAAQLRRGGEVRVQAALHRPLLPAGVSRVEVLREPIHRQGSALRGEGRVENAFARSGDQPHRLADHQLRHALCTWKQTLRELPRGAEHVIALPFFVKKSRVDRAGIFKLDVLALQPLAFKGKGLVIKKGRGGVKPRITVLLLTEHDDGIGFLLEFSCQQQREESAAEHGDCLFLLCPKDAAEL